MTVAVNPAGMPWEISAEADARFQRILRYNLIAFLILGLIIPWLPLPQPEKDSAVELPPRMAKLLLEAKPLPAPPKPEPVILKPQPQAKPEPAQQAAGTGQATGQGEQARTGEAGDQCAAAGGTVRPAGTQGHPVRSAPEQREQQPAQHPQPDKCGGAGAYNRTRNPDLRHDPQQRRHSHCQHEPE